MTGDELDASAVVTVLDGIRNWAGILATPITPAGSAADSLTTYILGFGPLGIIALGLAWVLYKGTFTLSGNADKVREEAVQRERERAGEWKALYLGEAAGHQKTRDALAISNSRADAAAAESAAITSKLVEAATRRDPARARTGKAPP